MFCKNCGAELADGAKFCESCGQAVEESGAVAATNDSTNATNTGVYSNVFANTSENVSVDDKGKLGMKWHIALQVILALGALLNFSYCTQYFTGSVYGLDENGRAVSSYVYESFPGMKGLDMFYGVVCIALAVWGIFVIVSLHGLKKNAPIFLFCLYGANIVFSLVYLGAGTAISGINLFSPSSIGSIVGAIFMIAVNKVYYDNRKHLLVN